MTRLSVYILVIVLLGSNACEHSDADYLEFTGQTMGTSYHVEYAADSISMAAIRIHEEIDAILADINAHMSTYISDSELSLFNQVNLPFATTLSDELYYVIRIANEISQLTDGAFDITVGPLVNLWGFGPASGPRKRPDAKQLQSTMGLVGFDKLEIDPEHPVVTKPVAGMQVDLSAIAKGYAVDRLAEHLESIGAEHYLVEIGGEVRARGVSKHGGAWRIGIEQPQPDARAIQRVANLENIAMATSGDYRNFFEEDGIRYSHTLDPATGMPVSHTLASISVLHESCVYADALATAFLVMGPDKTLALAKQLQLPVYMLIRSETGFRQQYNDYFAPYLSP